MPTELKCKLRAGKYKVPARLVYDGKKIFVSFGFNKTLIKEIKAMEGARWHGFDEDNPRKVWSIAASSRNLFQLEYLMGSDPYKDYDRDLVQVDNWYRPLYNHQKAMVAHALTRKKCIFACEMGTGKTLAAIEAVERIPDLLDQDCWYVGPKSGVVAVRREFKKWDCKITPEFMTYEGLVKRMRAWSDGDKAPRVVIFDESSRIKNPTAYRSQAARHLADAVREDWGDKGFVILMSGTPAPKTPVDWWHQAEVACPGFLKEGTQGKFKMRLCLIEERESAAGGVYPHIVTWLDNENKCAKCGVLKSEHAASDHDFEKSENEVAKLYRRLQGLVLVQFKKDCLDLPEKQYEIITVKPTAEMLRAAKLIQKRAPRVISALILMRELSDGFQYTEKESGSMTCPNCHGRKIVNEPIPMEEHDPLTAQEVKAEDFEYQEVECGYCQGTGEVPAYTREATDVKSPKDEVLIDQLDQHEEIGRLVVWGGFTGTIDRIVNICHQQGWATVRVDGRGYNGQDAHGHTIDSDTLLDAMDNSHPRFDKLKQEYPKVCFVGHPKAGGMALTLHASPTAIFYSNDFDGEARQQAEDRIHRVGMDANRGAKIIDIFCLKTDKLVKENLDKKKALQKISMGDLEKCMEEDGDG